MTAKKITPNFSSLKPVFSLTFCVGIWVWLSWVLCISHKAAVRRWQGLQPPHGWPQKAPLLRMLTELLENSVPCGLLHRGLQQLVACCLAPTPHSLSFLPCEPLTAWPLLPLEQTSKAEAKVFFT